MSFSAFRRELDDSDVADRLRCQRVRVPPLSPLCIQRVDLSGLIIGYGCLHEAAIPSVVQRITTTLREGRHRPQASLDSHRAPPGDTSWTRT